MNLCESTYLSMLIHLCTTVKLFFAKPIPSIAARLSEGKAASIFAPHTSPLPWLTRHPRGDCMRCDATRPGGLKRTAGAIAERQHSRADRLLSTFRNIPEYSSYSEISPQQNAIAERHQLSLIALTMHRWTQKDTSP